MTPLDSAHATMQADGAANGTADGARLQFYERLADAELFVLLTQEAEGEAISPALFEVEDGRFVLAFDLEERLAEFTGRVAPYAAMSGRVLVQMLAGQGIGLGLNLEVAPSSILIPGGAVDWLNRTLGQVPDRIEAQIDGFCAPASELTGESTGGLAAALKVKLRSAAGLAQAAYLVGVRYKGGGQGHLLGFVGAEQRAQDALAKAAGEALTFTGMQAGELDVGFFAPDDPVVGKLVAAGVLIEVPQPVAPPKATPHSPPGSDPDKPPILR